MQSNEHKFATRAIHAGAEPDRDSGAIMTPIYQTSTYKLKKAGVHQEYEYARSKNPTRSALESNIASLENAKFCASFSSGMAAVDALLKMCSVGDEVITSIDLYGGTYRLFETIYAKRGIKFHYISEIEASKVRELINANTKLIWLETPTNPLLKVIDIASIAKVSREFKVILAVDNTFATPYLQQPIKLGADIVMHSATKYLSGHSDVILGALVTNNDALAREIYHVQNCCGAISGPHDCFLVLRGIKTLHLRMQRHCENAMRVAQYLENHKKIDQVYYPGLLNSNSYPIAERQMNGFGGVVSFTLKEGSIQAAHRILERTKLFTLAESLGGVESLIGHPKTMSHASVPEKMQQAMGVSSSLMRISVGVEDVEDLLRDLQFAIM